MSNLMPWLVSRTLLLLLLLLLLFFVVTCHDWFDFDLI